MRHWQPSHPPRALRRSGVNLDNIALVPASLLPQKAAYQALANRLPKGELLIVLPQAETKQRQTLEQTAALWRAKGHPVTVVVATALAKGESR